MGAAVATHVHWARAARRLCLLVACSVALWVAVGHADGAGATGVGAKRGSAVSLRGEAIGLFPGVPVPLAVQIRNRTPHPLVLTSVRIRAGAAGAACAGTNFIASIPKGVRMSLAPRATVRTSYMIEMSPNAPDACQGATIPLRFQARVRR